MLFKKKEKKKPMLVKENIILNCYVENSDEAIVKMGELLEKGGYVEHGYIQGMLDRDHSLSTYLGNGVAIPHGEFEVSHCIKQTGMGVMVYPDGVQWGSEKAYLVIGIAAAENSHMDVLSNLAIKLIDPEDVNKLIHGSQEYIYQTITSE